MDGASILAPSLGKKLSFVFGPADFYCLFCFEIIAIVFYVSPCVENDIIHALRCDQSGIAALEFFYNGFFAFSGQAATADPERAGSVVFPGRIFRIKDFFAGKMGGSRFGGDAGGFSGFAVIYIKIQRPFGAGVGHGQKIPAALFYDADVFYSPFGSPFFYVHTVGMQENGIIFIITVQIQVPLIIGGGAGSVFNIAYFGFAFAVYTDLVNITRISTTAVGVSHLRKIDGRAVRDTGVGHAASGGSPDKYAAVSGSGLGYPDRFGGVIAPDVIFSDFCFSAARSESGGFGFYRRCKDQTGK